MSTLDNVSPDQFDQLYHGTASRMRPGSMITPGRASNYPGVTYDTQAQHVFATDDITTAWGHAANASSRANQGRVVYRRGLSPEDTGELPEHLPRPVYRPSVPRVYKVSPTGPIQVDPEQANEGMVPWDRDDPDFDGDRADSVQSRDPFRVTSRDVGAEAQRETADQYGADLNPYHHPRDHVNNAVGVHETLPQGNWPTLNKQQFGDY